MRSTVSTADTLQLGELLAPGGNGVTVEEATAVGIPGGLESRVIESVASLWRVDPGHVATLWGWIRDIASLDDDTDFRLVGRGADSWFAVVFEREGQPAFAARMRAGIEGRSAFATRRLAAGHVLDSADIQYQSHVQWGPARDIPRLVAEPGWRVHQQLGVGDELCEPAVRPIPVIHTGERIRLVWRRDVVTVSLEGTATHDAAVGQRIKVKLKGRRGYSGGIAIESGLARLDR